MGAERDRQNDGTTRGGGERGPARGREVAQVRGVLAERVVVSTQLDPFLGLRALADYSSLSVRKLRDHLEDPQHPLPCYRVGGKIVVRCSEFDGWIAVYRQRARADVAAIVADVLGSRDVSPHRARDPRRNAIAP